jgi:hypothetical protein
MNSRVNRWCYQALPLCRPTSDQDDRASSRDFHQAGKFR